MVTSKIKQNSERKRVRFSKKFKLEAVRLVELGQKPATQLALELGVPATSCTSGRSNWARLEKSTPSKVRGASQKMNAARMNGCVQNSNG